MIYELNIPQLTNIKKLIEILNKNKIKLKIIDYTPGHIVIEFNGNINEITDIFMKENLIVEKINPLKYKQSPNTTFLPLKIKYIHTNIYNFINKLKATNGIENVFLFKPLDIIIIIFNNNFIHENDIINIFTKNNIIITQKKFSINSLIKNELITNISYFSLAFLALINDFILKIPIISIIFLLSIILYNYKNYINLFSFIKKFKIEKKDLFHIFFLLQIIFFFISPYKYKPSIALLIYSIFNFLLFIKCKMIIKILKIDFLFDYIKEQIHSYQQININDIITIKPNEVIHYDGKIVDGSTNIDISIFSGKNKIIQRKKGDKVYAGEKVLTNPIKIKVLSKNYDSLIINLFNLYSKNFYTENIDIILDKNFTLIIIFILMGIIQFLFFNNNILNLSYKYLFMLGLLSFDFNSIKGIYELANLKRIFSYGVIIKNFEKYSKLSYMNRITISDEFLINKSNIAIKYKVFKKENQAEFLNIIYNFMKISNDFIAQNILEQIKDIGFQKFTIKDFHSIDNFNKYGKIVINNMEKEVLFGEKQWIQQNYKINLNNIPELPDMLIIVLVVDSITYGYLQIHIQENYEIINELKKIQNKLDITIVTNFKNILKNFKTIPYEKLNTIKDSILIFYNNYINEYDTSSNILISFVKAETAKYKTFDILLFTKRFYRVFELIAYKKFTDTDYKKIIKFINYNLLIYNLFLLFPLKIGLIGIFVLSIGNFYAIKNFINKQKTILLKNLVHEYFY